jgi:acyl-coenzyme A synthetase/AMP-(fatty) acid ligase
LYPSVRLEPAGAGYRVEAPYLPEPVVLGDALRQIDTRRFILEGRGSDLVNVAGKRASLAALNRVLLDIEGVADGTYLLPEHGDGATPRLVALVVAPGVDRAEILRQLRKELDPVFLPRAIHHVAALPRNETGKLPRRALEELLAECRRGRPGY